MTTIDELKSKYSLSAIIESLLFVSVMPITTTQLASVLQETKKKVNDAINNLEADYAENRGLRIQRNGSKIQLVTAPELADLIENFMGIEVTTSLSRASLETLAIIAFRQPVTRPKIEEIRGVNSDGVVRNLLSKGLIEEQGREEGVGRPILYGTTSEFLNHFGISSLKELPSIDIPEETMADNAGILKD